MLRTLQRNRRRRLGTVMATLAMAATAMAAATAVLVLPATPASADGFGGCDSNEGCVPDNFNHWYCVNGAIDVFLRGAFEAAMANLGETNYDIFEEGAGCNATTDLVVIQDTGLDARGEYSCQTFNGSGFCERANLRLNPDNLPTSEDQVKTACHEIGHSVGLRHGVDGVDNDDYTDCMHSGSIPPGLDFDDYDAHHIAHINGRR